MGLRLTRKDELASSVVQSLRMLLHVSKLVWLGILFEKLRVLIFWPVGVLWSTRAAQEQCGQQPQQWGLECHIHLAGGCWSCRCSGRSCSLSGRRGRELRRICRLKKPIFKLFPHYPPTMPFTAFSLPTSPSHASSSLFSSPRSTSMMTSLGSLVIVCLSVNF